MRSLDGFPEREDVWLEKGVVDGPWAASLLRPDGSDPFSDFVEPDFFEPGWPLLFSDKVPSRRTPANGL